MPKGGIVDGDAIMIFEVAGLLLPSAYCQIAGAGAHHKSYRTDLGGDQAAIRENADPNGDIDVLVDGIDDAVGQHKSQFDIRIGIQEFDRDRKQIHVPQAPGGCYQKP
jgi:hypothetical protein